MISAHESGQRLRRHRREVKTIATAHGVHHVRVFGSTARTRDHLAHRCFDTTRATVAATVTQDLPELRNAAERLLEATGD